MEKVARVLFNRHENSITMSNIVTSSRKDNTDPAQRFRPLEVSLVVNRLSSGPSGGVLGKTTPTDFHIYSRKCLLVLGYYIGITQLLLVSQPKTLNMPILYHKNSKC